MVYNCPNLLTQFMELQFTAIELNLFLDTHPNNSEALRDMKKVQEKLLAVMEEYEKQCGPLTPFAIQSGSNRWQWIDDPWPWEMTFN